MSSNLPAEDVCKRVIAMQMERTRHVAAIWRAESFRSTAGEAMTIRRARALNAVLERCDLPLTPGELLVGSGISLFSADADPEAVRKAEEYLRTEIGSRDFTTHFDHHAPDYPTLLKTGLGGLKSSVRGAQAARPDAFLESVAIALDGASRHLVRWAEALESEAGHSPEWRGLLERQAESLRWLAEAPPRSLHEAAQLVFLMHSIFQLDGRYAMAFGRLDQYLLPFYEADIASGTLTKDGAQTIFDHFIAKVAHRWDIQNICIGGLTLKGGDATNDLSFMILEAVGRIGRPGANVTARVHRATPPEFLRKCAEVVRTGIGYPAFFNDEIEVPALVAQGYPLEEARDYCFVGCIECFIPGRQAPWADSRFNLLRCVDLTLRDGGDAQDWHAFYDSFLGHLRSGIGEHARAINKWEQEADSRADDLTSPLLSALTRDCIECGLDVSAGGARYPGNHGIAGMGIGSTADALMAVKCAVYEDGWLTLAGLRKMLDANFQGFEDERRRLIDLPKYGNDEEDVDEIAVSVARALAEECLKFRTPRGGLFWGLMAANVQNVSAGREVGATPDGRLAFEPLSDAASPNFGRDKNGPTAVIHSVSKVDYGLHPGGNVINMRFHPSALSGEEGLSALASLVRTCFDLGGIQLQFNTTGADVLREAMDRPEDFGDLVVRVSGFSAYFTTLDRAVQQDILARTEHSLGGGGSH